MQPYGNNIIVKPFPSDGVSDGGIIVPDSVKKISNKVKIIKVGTGTGGKPMYLKEGQTAYRVKDWGTEIMVDNELYILMDAGAILAVE